jgi:hypothetical protein
VLLEVSADLSVFLAVIGSSVLPLR